jgi:GlcNAc-PI de-N-acetylase
LKPLIYQLTGASLPDAAVFVAPHPDDIAIAAGGLAAVLSELGVTTRMVLATDGSEARIPESALRRHGWTPAMSSLATRELRGRIRIAEGREEARCLGFGDDAVVVLNQRWHSEHRTPPDGLFDDLSLRDVASYRPGPIDRAAVDAMRSAINVDGEDVWLAIPHPDDRLVMHRIVTQIALDALVPDERQETATGALFYEALSTSRFSTPSGGREVTLGYDQEVMDCKRAAIRAHVSMAERRRIFGGYSTTGTVPYDELAHDRDRDLAGRIGHALPFAERFVLVDARDARPA